MGCLSKGLKPKALKRERVELPEFGGPESGAESVYVWVRAVTSRELIALREKYGDRESTANFDFACEMIALCCVQDDGQPIFEGGADVKANLDVSMESVTAIADKCVEVSGLAAGQDGKN